MNSLEQEVLLPATQQALSIPRSPEQGRLDSHGMRDSSGYTFSMSTLAK